MEEFKYKNFEDFLEQKGYKKVSELTQEQAVDYNGEYLKEMRDYQEEMMRKYVNDKDEAIQKSLQELDEKVNSTINDRIAEMLNVVKVQSDEIKKMKGTDISLEVSLTPFEKSIEDNMDDIKKGAEEPHSEKRTFVIKTAFTAASVVNNTDALRLHDIGQLAHRRLSVWESLPKVPVPMDANGTVRYTDWDEATKVRAAAMVAEGGTFPESTAVFEEYSITLKKVGDTIPITEESLYDRARFAAELRLFLQTNVNLVADQQVYDGDNTGNNMKGFVTTATPFVPAASGIADASIYDLIVKMKEAITQGKNSKYMPDRAYMNITDINAYKLKKDANNNYIMPPFVNDDGQTIDGITVIESNAVTANTVAVLDSRFVRIYEEPGMQVSTGLVGDQFREDLITLKARRRAQVLVREADREAVYFSDDIAADLVVLAS